MVGGGCVASCNSRPVTNASENRGFAFDSTGGERSAAQVPPLICHIIMPDMDEAADFARECMFDRHLSPAAVTGSGHIQRGMVVPEADVISPLVRRQVSTIQPVREDGEPCTSGTVPFVPSRYRGVVPAADVKEALLVHEPKLPCVLSGLFRALPVHSEIEGSGVLAHEGLRQVASGRK
jgi:hypothetical protein